MKRLSAILAVLALLCLCSCNKDNITGKVSYSFGFCSLSTSDIAAMSKIQNAYTSRLMEIDGLEVTGYSNTSFELANYTTATARKIVAACNNAEDSLAGFKPEDGYLTVELTALYWCNASEEIVYTHTFSAE